jgi:hypothetical protein
VRPKSSDSVMAANPAASWTTDQVRARLAARTSVLRRLAASRFSSGTAGFYSAALSWTGSGSGQSCGRLAVDDQANEAGR